jgi:hypothetical protein
MKIIQIRKEKLKLFLLGHGIILYLKDPKIPPKILLNIINTSSKVAGYEINTQKSIAFLYTNNKQTEKECSQKIPFTIASKTLKYLCINLIK